MSKTFSDLQYEKNGVTPQNIISDLTEQLNKGNIRALSVSYISNDGYANMRNWSRGADDEESDEGRINSTLLIAACDYAKLNVQGMLFGDDE